MIQIWNYIHTKKFLIIFFEVKSLTFEVDTNEMPPHEKHINYKEIFEHCNSFLVETDIDDIPLSILCELEGKIDIH